MALSSLHIHIDFVLDFIFGSHMRSVPPCRSGSLYELRPSGVHDFDRREEMLEISLRIHTKIFCGKSAKGLSGELTARNEMGVPYCGTPNFAEANFVYSKPCSCFS